MMRDAITGILAAAVLVAAAVLGSLAAPQLPRCPEDAVLIGVGAFQSGAWSRYVCGPAVDDYAP